MAEQDDARRPASVFKTEDMPSYNKGGGDGFIQETDYYQMKIGSIMAYSTDAAGNKTIEPVFEKIMYGADGWINDNLMQTGSIHDLVLIRFADVLLMQSELKEDVSGINRVRSRAGLEPIGTYSLAALQNERRWELCFEGTAGTIFAVGILLPMPLKDRREQRFIQMGLKAVMWRRTVVMPHVIRLRQVSEDSRKPSPPE